MAEKSLKKYLYQTMQRIIEPIARVALLGELSHRDFVEASKRAFFKVARDDHGISGRKTNLARVAILTGLSRKECSRLKELENKESSLIVDAMNPCTKVISAWYQRQNYQDADGNPMDLSPTGPEPSLEHLVRQTAGDMPNGAVVKELARWEVIVRQDDNKWRITRRSFIPPKFNQEKIRIMGNQLSDLGATIYHNMTKEDDQPARLQRYLVHENMPEEVADQFQKLVTIKSQELLEEFDLWLEKHKSDTDDSGGDSSKTVSKTGLGVYFYTE